MKRRRRAWRSAICASARSGETSDTTGLHHRAPPARHEPRRPARRVDDRRGRDPAGDGLRHDRRACRSRSGSDTALVPMAAYALIGTSRALVGQHDLDARRADRRGRRHRRRRRPDRALAAATTLAMLSGALLLAAGALRLGFIADFISQPVLAGFKAGTGPADRGRPARQGARDRADRRLVLREAALARSRTSATSAGRTAGAGVRRRSRCCWRSSAGRRASRARCSRSAPGIAIGAAGLLDVALTGAGSVAGCRTPGRARPRPDRAAVAGGAGHRADGVRGVDRRRTRGRAPRRALSPNADRELLALGAANLAGGVFRALARGRRPLADGGQRQRARPSSPAPSRRSSRCSRCCS